MREGDPLTVTQPDRLARMLTILTGAATWEREIMLERQREGIAKAAGKHEGRPTSIDAVQVN